MPTIVPTAWLGNLKSMQRLRVLAIIVEKEPTSKRLLLMQLLVPLPAQFVCPERIKIPPAVYRASFVHRGQS